MGVLYYNFSWMIYNSFLALLAVGLGYIFFQAKGKFFKTAFGILWLLFLPNTIYIFTDLMHLIEQWTRVSPSAHGLLLLQYLLFEIIGIATFLFAFFPFEKLLRDIRFFKKNKVSSLIAFNFLIAFGMVLGRVERINSWQIFTSPLQVYQSVIHVLTSFDLLGLTMLFGLLCNFIYFLFRKKALSYAKKIS